MIKCTDLSGINDKFRLSPLISVCVVLFIIYVLMIDISTRRIKTKILKKSISIIEMDFYVAGWFLWKYW